MGPLRDAVMHHDGRDTMAMLHARASRVPPSHVACGQHRVRAPRRRTRRTGTSESAALAVPLTWAEAGGLSGGRAPDPCEVAAALGLARILLKHPNPSRAAGAPHRRPPPRPRAVAPGIRVSPSPVMVVPGHISAELVLDPSH